MSEIGRKRPKSDESVRNKHSKSDESESPNPDGRVQNLMEMPSPLVMDVSSVFLEICKVCLTRFSETKKKFWRLCENFVLAVVRLVNLGLLARLRQFFITHLITINTSFISSI